MVLDNNFTVEQDWSKDGMLKLTNVKTLKRYRELCREYTNVDIQKYDCFFAFSNTQFAEGLKTIRPLKEGEELVNFAPGGYGTKDGVEQLNSYYKSIKDTIAKECDPYEIYCYEYNNHESFLSWDGDLGAIQIIIDTFGTDVAKSIERFSAQYAIERI